MQLRPRKHPEKAARLKAAAIIEQKKYTTSMIGQCLPCGDRMVLVEFEAAISEEINDAVHGLAAAIEAAEIAGIIEWVPSYRSLGVYYDPLRIQYAELVQRLNELERKEAPGRLRSSTRVEIPVVYGGRMGPDLESVARLHRITPEEVIALHTGGRYRVFLIGFTPGFPYLGGLHGTLATPRLPTPRSRVPEGSVAIGGQQTGIYPVESPGGWRLIGRTPLRLFDVGRRSPCVLKPGDQVVFRSISEAEFQELAAARSIR